LEPDGLATTIRPGKAHNGGTVILLACRHDPCHWRTGSAADPRPALCARRPALTQDRDRRVSLSFA